VAAQHPFAVAGRVDGHAQALLGEAGGGLGIAAAEVDVAQLFDEAAVGGDAHGLCPRWMVASMRGVPAGSLWTVCRPRLSFRPEGEISGSAAGDFSPGSSPGSK